MKSHIKEQRDGKNRRWSELIINMEKQTKSRYNKDLQCGHSAGCEEVDTRGDSGLYVNGNSERINLGCSPTQSLSIHPAACSHSGMITVLKLTMSWFSWVLQLLAAVRWQLSSNELISCHRGELWEHHNPRRTRGPPHPTPPQPNPTPRASSLHPSRLHFRKCARLAHMQHGATALKHSSNGTLSCIFFLANVLTSWGTHDANLGLRSLW